MKIGSPRISVLVITYKQENLIRRALDSLLAQRDYIYEICVSDDCSPDKTWEVLQEYSTKFPGLFKLHRNSQNVGIFANIEQTWLMPTGDVVYCLSGDDQCGDSWLKNVYQYICSNIDWKNESFTVFGDYKIMYPSGDSFVSHTNKLVLSKNSLLRLYTRGLICGRSACFSVNVLKKFTRISKGRSYEVEMAQDSLLFIYTQKAYYLPQVGNIYMANIGVSETVLKNQRKTNPVYPIFFAMKFYSDLGISINKQDFYLPQKSKARKELLAYKSPKSVMHFLKYWILTFDCNLTFTQPAVKHFFFRLIRRLPHKRAIQW